MNKFELCHPIDRWVKTAVKIFSVVFVTFENIGTKSVIGIDINVGGGAANHWPQTLAHIAGTRFGKSETENILRICVGVFKNIGHFGGKELSFASAGTGQH